MFEDLLFSGLMLFGVMLCARFLLFLFTKKEVKKEPISAPQATDSSAPLNPNMSSPCPPHAWAPRTAPEGADKEKFYGLYCKKCPAQYPGLV